MSETMQRKADDKKLNAIIHNQVSRIRYLGHAMKYVGCFLSAQGDSRELESLANAQTTLELALQHAVWNE